MRVVPSGVGRVKGATTGVVVRGGGCLVSFFVGIGATVSHLVGVV